MDINDINARAACSCSSKRELEQLLKDLNVPVFGGKFSPKALQEAMKANGETDDWVPMS